MGIWDRSVRFECFTPARVRAICQFIRLDKQARELASQAAQVSTPARDPFPESADLHVHVSLLRSA